MIVVKKNYVTTVFEITTKRTQFTPFVMCKKSVKINKKDLFFTLVYLIIYEGVP